MLTVCTVVCDVCGLSVCSVTLSSVKSNELFDIPAPEYRCFGEFGVVERAKAAALLGCDFYIGGVDRITVLDINDHRHSLDNLIKNCNNDEKEAIDIAIKGILYMPVIDKRSQRTYSVGSPPASLPPMLAEFALSDSTTIDKVSTDKYFFFENG